MKKTISRSSAIAGLFAIGVMTAASTEVLAAASVGGGLRASLDSVENAAPSGSDDSSDFNIDARLYVSGDVTDGVKFTLNTMHDSTNGMQVQDAIAQFEFSESFNLWLGRMLPPSDRANLSGPYFQNAWTLPQGLFDFYPAGGGTGNGRDDGVAVWGQTNGGQFKYQLGLFDGAGVAAGGPNQEDSVLTAARVVANFWAPEPGYYNSSTYYGAKDVLAVGAGIISQADALGTAAAPRDYSAFNIDFLMEKKLGGGGVATAEAAYYDVDKDGTGDVTDYYVLGSYLFPSTGGAGQWQPMLRFQNQDIDGGLETDITDVGVNYIIDGHNARISFIYSNVEPSVGNSTTAYSFGAQLQI